MDQPRFSVVIPLYNKRDDIGHTLRSVLAQQTPADEIIVIDDGSIDGGDDLVAAMADKGPPVPITLVRQANAGPGPARNRGVGMARGTWIAFADADDVWRQDHLASLAAIIAHHPQAPLAGTAYLPIVRGQALPQDAAPGLVTLEDFYAAGTHARFCTSSVAVRRQAVLAAGGFAPVLLGEDTDLWIRLALEGPFALGSARTVGYLRGNGGLMESAPVREDRLRPSPVFATVAALLADPAHAPRHDALAAYGDRLRRRFAFQHIYRGCPRAARDLLRGCCAKGPGWAALRLACAIPPAVVRLAARGWRGVRR